MALPTTIPAEAVVDQLFSQNSVGVAVLDREGRYVRINEALAAIHAEPVAAHIGRTPMEVLPWAADALEPLVRQVLGGDAVVDLRGEVAGRSFTFSYLPVRTGDEVTGLIGLVVETTESQCAEAALRVSQERLQLAL